MAAFNFVIHLLAALTCFTCTLLLFREAARSASAVLRAAAVCFGFLTLNNLLLFFELPAFAGTDLRPHRLFAAFAGLLVLIYGVIIRAER